MSQSRETSAERLNFLQRAIPVSTGWLRAREIKNLIASFNTLERNYDELKRIIDIYKRPDFVLGNNDKNISFSEVVRLLHNFLAASQTLREHTKNFVDSRYKNSRLRDEFYQKRKGDLDSNMLLLFVHRLRDYAQHMGIPVPSASFNMQGAKSQPTSFLNLSMIDIRSWKGWRREPKIDRTYLDGLGEDAELEPIIDKYMDALKKFYFWFIERHAQEHEDEFRELREMRIEASTILSRLRTDEGSEPL